MGYGGLSWEPSIKLSHPAMYRDSNIRHLRADSRRRLMFVLPVRASNFLIDNLSTATDKILWIMLKLRPVKAAIWFMG